MSTRLATRIYVTIAVSTLGMIAAAVYAQAPPNQATPPAALRSDVPPAAPKPVEPGYLGLVTDDRQDAGKGVRVMEALGGSPAERAGLRPEDLIVGIDGKAVHGNSEMGAVVGSLPPGSQVVFDIERNGQKQQINVTLGKRPPAAERRFEQFGPVEETLPAPSSGGPTQNGSATGRPSAGVPSIGGTAAAGGPRPVPRGDATDRARAEVARRPLLGVRTQPVTAEARQRLRLSSTSGALVVARTAGSPADKAGIPFDSVIVAFNGIPVESPTDLARIISQSRTHDQAEIAFIVDGETRRAKVVLGDATAAPGPIAPRESPLPIAPTPLPDPAAAPNDYRAEIDALKRRVQELEQRVHELEQAGKK